VVKGPGYLEKNCLINLPSWADFDFTSRENVTGISIIHSHEQSSDRTILKIPPGPPAWELKVTRPAIVSSKGTISKSKDYVVIGDG